MPKHPLRMWRDHHPEMMSQTALANMVGIKQQGIAKVEGGNGCSLEVACRLHEVTGLDIMTFRSKDTDRKRRPYRRKTDVSQST